MADPRWEQVKALFDRALEVGPDERDELVAEACGDDAALADEVRALLCYDAEPGGLIGHDEPPGGPAIATGARLGAYELEEVIGSGGMGTVYRARRCDEEFQKRVAIKLVKPGMDSEEVMRRFRQERQMLASLEHPNIARLIDGGATDDGRPYLVMEHVEGTPIDEYAARRATTVEERLDLFTDVCAAVQHAHQNLVVHRDLKPSNIVVTDDGEVKLLDFGIAKMLSPETVDRDATAVEQRPMTPRYASPEQVRGAPITTATDVYALGVLLYELLAGARPYEFTTHTPAEYERLICDVDPPRPSEAVGDDVAARRRLRGDLDTIVLKAMHKQPTHRYATVEQLAEDIRRHRAGLPVLARPDTVTYRAGRFVRRHRVSVAAAAAVLVAIVAGAVASTILFFQAAEERDRAQQAEADAVRRFEQVRALARTMMYDVHDKIQALPGATPVREFLVDTSLEYLNALAADAGDDLGLVREVAGGYHRMANVQGMQTLGNLGDVEGALDSATRARDAWLEVTRHDPGDVEAGGMLASTHRTRGDMLLLAGRAAEAHDAYTSARALIEQLVEINGESWKLQRQLQTVALKLGDLHVHRGERERALTEYEQAIAMAERLAAAHPGEIDVQRDLGLALSRTGLFHFQAGKPEVARPMLLRALEQALELRDSSPSNAQLLRDLIIAHERLGDVARAEGDLDAAQRQYTEQLALATIAAESDPGNAMARKALSLANEKVGDLAMSRSQADVARESYRRALEITSSLGELDPGNTVARLDVGICHQNVGIAADALGDLAAAERSFEQMHEIGTSVLAADPDSARAYEVVMVSAGRIAGLRMASGRAGEAVGLLERVHGTATTTAERHPGKRWAQYQLGMCRNMLGSAYERRGTDETRGDDERRADLIAARGWYEAARDQTQDMLDRGLLREREHGMPAMFDADIARCDELLEAWREG